jgi:hypothetical protein
MRTASYPSLAVSTPKPVLGQHADEDLAYRAVITERARWRCRCVSAASIPARSPALMNLAGNIGGTLSPLVFGALVQLGSWVTPFIVAAALLVAGAAVWAFWLDPEMPVLERRAKVTARAMLAE